MEEINKALIQNDYANNIRLKFFFDKFLEKRNTIFEYIYEILEDNNDNEKENQLIQEIINQEYSTIDDKIEKIKDLKCEKYYQNYNKNYNSEGLKKYNLGLFCSLHPTCVQLVYYENNEEIKEDKDKQDSNQIENNNDNPSKNDEKKNVNNDKEKKEEKNKKFTILFDIDILTKIKINDDEEWICNSDYALYLIHIIKHLKNPHPTNIDEELSDESSYSLTDKQNMDHLFFISNNKNNSKKKIIEVKADLNCSDIYRDIKEKGSSDFALKFIKNSLPGININDIKRESYTNNRIYRYFKDLCNFKPRKNIIFQDENYINSFAKIISLNHLYFKEDIRYLYLDLNVLDKIEKTNEKRNYLSYFIARIFNCDKNFKEDFETFVNENIKDIRDKNFYSNFIEKIIAKNNDLIKNNDERTPLYIIIDNIESDKGFNLFEKLINDDDNENIYIYGIINIDSIFGQNKFLKLYNKKYTERGKIGYYIHYLYSNDNGNIKESELNRFFEEIKTDVKTLPDFIQLLYFREYINECFHINIDFLMKYIKYIKLIISEDISNRLEIKDIEFKNEEIKKKFILNYKNILVSYLNNDNDEYIKRLFSETNGVFFEKQIILDILLNKIKGEHSKNFKELNVHTIYCMDFDINKIDINQYKNNDIIIIQNSQTGEIYDFGIIVNNSIKLYQVSIKKSADALSKLEKNLIEVDCEYMMKKGLNNICNSDNFSFGIITSKSTFIEYSNLIEEKKKLKDEGIENKNKIDKINNKIKKTSYFLMKDHCQINKYELFIFDLKTKTIYIEDSSNKLIEYNLYQFHDENKLNIPNLENIFKFKPKKLSLKYYKKENFIKKLNETELFSDLENDANSLNIVAKFDYQKEFLNIENIKEDNYFIYINGKEKKDIKRLEIIKYKNETIVNEISQNKRISCENYNVKINKKESEVILFKLNDEKKFLGKKRKQNTKKEK